MSVQICNTFPDIRASKLDLTVVYVGHYQYMLFDDDLNQWKHFKTTETTKMYHSFKDEYFSQSLFFTFTNKSIL
jgi:hypothetical protein